MSDGMSASLSSLNQPHIVATTGAVIVVVFPLLPSPPLAVMKVGNILAFLVNVAAFAQPGRLDREHAASLFHGDESDSESERAPDETTNLMTTPDGSNVTVGSNDDTDHRDADLLQALRRRTMMKAAKWSIAIWVPIFLGEAVFCIAQLFPPVALQLALPNTSIPFIAANLLQSLWCAAYRPSYQDSWHQYISCLLLLGTAYALSYIPFYQSWYLIPMAMHFAWVAVAALIDFNSSLAMSYDVVDTSVVAVGHTSSVLATTLGVVVTVFDMPNAAFGLTMAWALAAIASNIELEVHEHDWADVIQSGARVQRALCWTGTFLCVAGTVLTYLL